MNVSLKFVFAILSVAALSIAALTRPTLPMMWLFIVLTLTLLVVSVFLAFTKAHGSKSFWIWFSIASLGYLAFAALPDRDGNFPRQTGPSPTTRLLVSSYDFFELEPVEIVRDSPEITTELPALDDAEYSSPTLGEHESFGGFGGQNSEGFGGQESSQSNQLVSKDFSGLMDLIAETLPKGSGKPLPYAVNLTVIVEPERPHFRRFMVIGHCVWAICLGLVWGVSLRS